MPLARGRDPICAQCPSSRNQLPSGPPICGQGGCNYSIHSRLVFRLWYQQSHARIEVIHSEKGGASVWPRWRPGFGNFSGLIRGTRLPSSMVVGLWPPGQTAMHQRNIKLNHTFACPVASRAMARRVCRNLQQCSYWQLHFEHLSILGLRTFFFEFLYANLVKQTHHCHQYCTQRVNLP